eukprot:2667588-Pleurochrysis_carterae.AAC.1
MERSSPDSPRRGVCVKRDIALRETEPDRAMMREIHKHPVGRCHKLCGRAAHRPAQHFDRKCHVGSGLRGAVKQSANEGLVRRHEVVVDVTIRFGAQRVFHQFRQVFGCRRARRVEG